MGAEAEKKQILHCVQDDSIAFPVILSEAKDLLIYTLYQISR